MKGWSDFQLEAAMALAVALWLWGFVLVAMETWR